FCPVTCGTPVPQFYAISFAQSSRCRDFAGASDRCGRPLNGYEEEKDGWFFVLRLATARGGAIPASSNPFFSFPEFPPRSPRLRGEPFSWRSSIGITCR